MKKLFILFAFVFSVLQSYGQTYPQHQNVSGPHLMGQARGWFAVDSAFVLKYSYPDTSTANLSAYTKFMPGAEIRVGNKKYMRSVDLTRWIEIGAGALNTESSSTINFEGNGSTESPLKAHIRASQQGGNAVQLLEDGLFIPNNIQNGLISGGIITWVSGYTYDVSPATYGINYISYSSVQAQITLANADATFNRIDLVVVNIYGGVEVIAGTPAADPQQPSYNPATQLPLSFILVTANTTAPAITPVVEYIYLNNAEWTTASSSARINPASTSNPFSPTLDIEGTLAQDGDNIGFTDPSPLDLTLYNTLTFQLRSKVLWENTSGIKLQWYSGGTPVGLPITVANNTYGFYSGQTSSYQIISIPMYAFGSTTGADNLLMTVTTQDGNTIGFYIDNVQLQNGGISNIGNKWSQGGDSWGQTGIIGTNDSSAVAFKTNNVERMRLTTAGNLLFNKTSDLLQNFKVQIQGNLALFNNSGSSQVHFFNGAANIGRVISNGNVFSIQGMRTLTANEASINLDGPAISFTQTSGDYSFLRVNSASNTLRFAPTSGTATFKTIHVRPEYNQTGTANGSVYGIYYDPAITSLLGTHYGLYINSGKNYFADETLIGSTTDNGDYKLQVTGGTRIDATGKNITWVGLSTDNTATQVAAKNTSGNLVWRDVSSISGGGGTYTADNGLVMTGNTVQLGADSPLGSIFTGDRYINTDVSNLTFTGTNAVGTLLVNNTGSGNSIYVSASNNWGVFSASTDGGGLSGHSANYLGIEGVSENYLAAEFTISPASTSTIETIMKIHRNTTGTPANGLGGAIDFDLQSSTLNRTSNQIISRWTDKTDASRTSEFIITGVSGGVTADLLTISGNGAQKWGGYGTGAITSTPAFGLAVDASGNVIEIALGGGGGGTVNSVAGTSNQITSTGGTDPIIGISPTYAGQNSIITLGTITTGVWNGTPIADGYISSAATWNNKQVSDATLTALAGLTITNGSIIYGTGADAFTVLAAGTNGQVLTLSGGVPVWGTAGTGTLTAVNGTTNQITANTVGSVVTLSTPQDIHTTAIPQFLAVRAVGNGTYSNGFQVSGSINGTAFSANYTMIAPTGQPAYMNSFAGNITEPSSGNASVYANVRIAAPSITSGAGTVTNTATLLVENAMTATVSNANYAAWIVSGKVRIGDVAGTGNRYVQADVDGVLSATLPVFNPTVQSLADGATITWNVANGGNGAVTLAGTGRTLSITNPTAGHTYTIRIIQGSGGSKTITTWPTGTVWPNGTAPTLSTTAGKMDIIILYYDGTSASYYGNYVTGY